MLSTAPFRNSTAPSAFIQLRHVFYQSHVVSGRFRSVNKVLDGSVGLQAHNPGRLPHSCPLRLRAYQPRQAQKPTMETMVTATRAKVFPTSLAAAGRIRQRKMSHMMVAAFESLSLGAMLSQVGRSGSLASVSDDAKGGQTSWSAQPITDPLYSSLACRTFLLLLPFKRTVSTTWVVIPVNLNVSDEINVKHPLKHNQSRVVTLFPCQCFVSQDRHISQPHQPLLSSRLELYLSSCDRDRITPLPDFRKTLVFLGGKKETTSSLKSVMLP